MIQDRDVVNDLIKDARFLVTCESFCSVESSPQIKGTFLDVIREDQDQHTRLFQFAQSKGWYSTLWGDIGYQQPAGGYAQPQFYGAGGYTPAYQPEAAAGQVTPGAWLQPSPGAAWPQQPAGTWSQQQPGTVAARPGNTGAIEVAGRQYGPY